MEKGTPAWKRYTTPGGEGGDNYQVWQVVASSAFAICYFAFVFYMNSFPFVASPAFAILYLTFGIFYFISIVFNDPLVASPVFGVFLSDPGIPGVRSMGPSLSHKP